MIDTAKAIGMLAVNGGNVEDYQMNEQVTAVPPLFIAVPWHQSSGTGGSATKHQCGVANTSNGRRSRSFSHTTMILWDTRFYLTYYYQG